MAIQDEGLTVPQSTGAVATPTEPVTTEQTPGHPVSTGAVETPPVTATTFGPLGQDSTGAVETPGPVRTRNISVKVVRAPAKTDPAAATTAETPETDGAPRPARHADDPASQK